MIITTPTDFEDTKLITPGELRAVLRDLRERAEKHAPHADLSADPEKAARASGMRFAADQIGDLIQDSITAATKAENERLQARALEKAAQAEREEQNRQRAEAYRNRPILGLREGDVLVHFPSAATWRHAPVPAVHIGYADDGVYLVRCGAHEHATYSGRKIGDYQREATCKRCIKIAQKEGLL